MKLVVITGCLGLIGNYVTRKCLEQGWKVLGIDKKTYAANNWALEEFNNNPNFTFIECDIAKLTNLPDCDYVVNIAAESHVGNSIVDSSSFIETNINGVKNLLDLIRFKQDNVTARPIFLHFSTDEVYGDIEAGAHTEKDLLKPSNPYSATKAAADQLILAWARTFKVPYVIVRPTNNYGIGQYTEKFIPKSIKSLQLGRTIPLHDAGLPKRTWLHVSDTASAIIKIIESGVQNEIYNILGNYEEQNIIIAMQIIDAFFPTVVDPNNYLDLSITRPGQDVRYSIDDSKLRNLGWNPNAVFEVELIKIVQYYSQTFVW